MEKVEYYYSENLKKYVLYITKKDGSVSTIYSEAVINLKVDNW